MDGLLGIFAVLLTLSYIILKTITTIFRIKTDDEEDGCGCFFGVVVIVAFILGTIIVNYLETLQE